MGFLWKNVVYLLERIVILSIRNQYISDNCFQTSATLFRKIATIKFYPNVNDVENKKKKQHKNLFKNKKTHIHLFYF